eukprot:CAMPEP_0115015188 /NCGR_PEP_ID=MMETSP0216-20121206/26591_1 /TAXON_ID=223996 /ORGANISM="Protocruzia adherens, Strain Boccale" /LENGTH=159 /DNA_ID=CAMNT_0002385203 /DNA_START=337 /DNA_END=816 /DNA_ORIENTATION=+
MGSCLTTASKNSKKSSKGPIRPRPVVKTPSRQRGPIYINKPIPKAPILSAVSDSFLLRRRSAQFGIMLPKFATEKVFSPRATLEYDRSRRGSCQTLSSTLSSRGETTGVSFGLDGNDRNMLGIASRKNSRGFGGSLPTTVASTSEFEDDLQVIDINMLE